MFRVYARFRPLNEREKRESNDELLLDRDECDRETIVVRGNHPSNNRRDGTRLSFKLDRVHYEASTQRDVYDETIREHVTNFIRMTGDTNIITYGQTSSGKTYTVDGDFYHRDRPPADDDATLDEHLGIMPRILYELCSRYGRELTVSYYEIYCEKIFDLLTPSPRECRFSENNGQITMDVTRYAFDDNNNNANNDDNNNDDTNDKNIRDAETGKRCFRRAFQVLRAANANRHFGYTAMNSRSSRSHTFLELRCPTNAFDAKGNNNKSSRVKVLRVIDLAGSERPSKTQTRDKAMSEGININNSLMYLKQMIEIIATNNNGNNNKTLPKFRESKLTRIIHASINASRARVVLMLCCSPSVFNYHETVNTLRFGSKAIQIERKTNDANEIDQLLNARDTEQLLQTERALTLRRLHELEQTLTAAQDAERKRFERRIEEYEEQLRRLKDSANERVVSMDTYRRSRETIELQRRIINELTNEKMQMRNELNIYQLFREYMIAAIEDQWNDDDDDNNDDDNNNDDRRTRERMNNVLKLLDKY